MQLHRFYIDIPVYLVFDMPWDLVEFDFGGDETTNFGPRREEGSALYQVDTLATISSSDKVSHSICGSTYEF